MKTLKNLISIGILSCAIFFINVNASGHCDTKNGPVLTAAKEALNTGNVNLILIWVQPKDEPFIKELFDKTVKLRKINPEVQDLADRNFFENLVRIHRTGEGAPYTGIKEASEIEPSIEAADKAIESGKIDDLLKITNDSVEKVMKEKFEAVIAHKNYDKNDVKAEREFVEAYISFIHFVGGIYNVSKNFPGEHHPEFHGKEERHPKNEPYKTCERQSCWMHSGNYVTNILIVISTLLILGFIIFYKKR
jgi:hypothetical protein